jgi:hypothetical protein
MLPLAREKFMSLFCHNRQLFLEVPPRTPPFLALKRKWGVQVGLGVPDSLTAIDLNSGTQGFRVQQEHLHET